MLLNGVPADLLDEYGALLPTDPKQLELVLACGAAWALGVRNASPESSATWRPVVSGIGLGPPSFPKRTGETLVQLIMSSRHSLRMAPAYLDAPAAIYLGPSIAAATKRGVDVSLLLVEQLEKDGACNELMAILEGQGNPTKFRLIRAKADDWFAHMKVLSVDRRSAYIGSANTTMAGLSTNFELGALVEGRGVEIIEAFLDRVERVIES